MKATWSVVAVYEGGKAKQTAVTFCESLVERFWARFGFDISWWSFETLQDGTAALESARKAAEADLIVFATGPSGELPWHVQEWIEAWLARRQEKEGALAALHDPETEPGVGLKPAHSYLRNVAHRGCLDFLTQVPQSIPDPFAETPEFYTNRAKEVTSVLDDILRQPPPPGMRV